MPPKKDPLLDKGTFLKEAQKRVSSGNMLIPTGKRQQIADRGIIKSDIENCFKLGRIIEGPHLNERGKHQATIQRFGAGQKLRVVAVLDGDVLVIVRSAHIKDNWS